MRKFSMLIASMAMVASLASCEKNNEPYADRTPNKVDFVERSLEGITIGAELTDAVEAVDLGLSVKWANMNLGATSATDGGAKYAWAEIKSKENNQHWDGYEYGEFSGSAEMNLTKYCYDFFGENQDLNGAEGNTLHKNDDAAYVAWGEGWNMPTEEQMNELVNNCTWEYDSAKKAYVVTGTNGNSIVIPIPTIKVGEEIYKDGKLPSDYYSVGYWTSSLSKYVSTDAQLMIVAEKKTIFSPGINRCVGLQIRPVYTK